MPTSFSINQADLEFMLRQIRIAEAHGSGTELTQAIQNEYGLSPNDAALAPFGLRTVDGRSNNLLPGQDHFGAADTPFPRLLDPVYVSDAEGSIDFDGVGPAPASTQGDYSQPGDVIDSAPRAISNLIVNQTIDNPAAVEAWFANPLSLEQFEADHPGMNPVRPGEVVNPNDLEVSNADISGIFNQSPDIGLSPSFNAWMTFFGQFFDHGLDLVTKSSNGTVYIPLAADDPLRTHGLDGIEGNGDEVPDERAFMVVTRAKVNGNGDAENTTTPFVDQNQTYTSHPSHHVFLREYALVGGKPESTGHLLDSQTALGGVNGAPATWGETKAQARDLLGIELTDFDVHSAPLLLTDQYGNFIPGANGFPQMVMEPDAMHPDAWLKEGDPLAPITTAGAKTTGHQFLVDIAHHSVPSFFDHDGDDHNNNGIADSTEGTTNQAATARIAQTADLDVGDPTLVADDHDRSTYDNEMLDAHFVTGDGRGNENIALTAVHSVFHSEHNRLVEAYKHTILGSGDRDFINEWLAVDLAPTDPIPTHPAGLAWDGARLFQAARFVTEMQYQHLVFEEFARTIQPNVDPFVFTNDAQIDPSIIAEFAHTVYRFGHSMLSDTVDRLDNNMQLMPGETEQSSLIEAFLNPQMFTGTGADIGEIIANIARGTTHDRGSEIDEFVVPALQNNLLGLPLDLPAINLARGRENGIPSLNETREQLYNDFGLADLKPYTSWLDFAQHLKHPASIINFIAAYGTHASITAESTIEGKRAAASELVLGVDMGVGAAGAPTDRLDFLNARGDYSLGGDHGLGGLNDVDLWVGGLAEELNEFGGMLGATFNFIFEYQMEHLQTGDRFYYLSRTQGTNILNQLEPNTFTDLVMRNSDLGGDYATHMYHAIFGTPDGIYELDRGIAQTDYNPDDPNSLDPIHDDPFLQAIDPKVARDYTGATQLAVDTGVMGPQVVTSVALANASFEDQVMGGGVGTTNANGSFLSGNPQGWTLSAGGTWAPETMDVPGDLAPVSPTGPSGSQVAFLNDAAVLSQDVATSLIEGAIYTLTFDLGDRFDRTATGGTARILDANGLELGRTDFDAPAVDGGWRTVTVTTAAIAAASAGLGLTVEITKADVAGGTDQIMVDNVQLTSTEPGSSIIVTHDVGGMLRYSGGEHVVLGGTEGNDRLYGDKGIDTLWGDGGDDYLNAGMESDHVFGGDGDDIIEDPFGDDFLRGEGGNDVISAGSGLDLAFGGEGQDYIMMGQDDGEAFGDEGNDFILGGTSNDFLLGGEGHDWIEGGDGFDVIAGENSELFFNSPIIGHDVLWGQGGDQDYDSESGDDIMLSGPGVQRFEGMFGFDWAISKYDPLGADFDFQIPIFTSVAGDILRDRFDLVEAASGWKYTDVLDGDDRGHSGGSSSPDSAPEAAFADHVLTAEGIDRIDGLREFLGGDTATGVRALETLFGEGATEFFNGNLLIGGDGNDFLRGRGGNDIMDGDAWLNVRIKIVIPDGPNAGTYSAESMNTDTNVAGMFAGKVYNVGADGQPDFDSPAFGGATLNSLMLNRSINPGDMEIVREILTDKTDVGTATSNIDTAIFQGTFAEYTIEGSVDLNGDGDTVDAGEFNVEDLNNDGFITVRDNDDGVTGATVDGVTLGSRGALTDDTDLIRNIESLVFADQTIRIGGFNSVATGTVTINDPSPFDQDLDGTPDIVTPYVGQVLTATLSNLMDADLVTIDPETGLPASLRWEWQTTETGSNAGWTTITTADEYTVRSVDPGHVLRAVAVFEDNAGVTERIISATTDGALAPYHVAENSQMGTVVAGSIPFSVDYDPLALGNVAPVDVDPTLLDHRILDSAGGRFTITGAPGSQRIVVDNGGPASLDYEAIQSPVDNEYQIVVETYSDTAANGGELVARRQFTVQLTDVSPEAPVDILWIGAAPSGLPDAGEVLANLQVVDTDSTSWTFGENSSFVSIDAGGSVSVSQSMSDNQTESFEITATDSEGQAYVETVNIQIANGADNIAVAGTADTDIIFARGGNDTVEAGDGDDTVYGQNGNDTLIGGRGNDVLWGLNQDDTIIWNANETGETDGRDLVDGGANTDAFVVNGRSSETETFRIYAAAAAMAAGFVDLASATEIVVTRNGSVIAELDNIEEIVVNTQGVSVPGNDPNGGTTTTSAGGDTIEIIGDFNTTSLNFSTITINGGDGDDTVDISELTSDHRIVFHGGGGDNHVIGNLRPQDVVDNISGMPAGSSGMPSTEVDDDDDGEDAGDGGNGSGAPQSGTIAAAALTLMGTSGEDMLVGDTGNDVLDGGGAADLLKGGEGNDVVFGGDGADKMFGDGGDDMLFGDAGYDRIFGGEGNDYIEGGKGGDIVFAGAGDDVVVHRMGDGKEGDTWWGGDGVDTLDFTASAHDLLIDLGNGPMGRGSVTNIHGHVMDTVYEFENVLGGSGNDTIIANNAVNVMDGGAGNDTFVFNSAAAADGDMIVNFQPGDRIDLSGIDADTGSAGDQSFVLFAGGNFTAAGQLAVTYENRADGEHTILSGNTDSDADADFALDIAGHHDLTGSALVN